MAGVAPKAQRVKGQTAGEPFVPVYRRLFDTYRNGILTQRYAPGGRIDSIREIRKVHGLSRETARPVLGMLAGEGL